MTDWHEIYPATEEFHDREWFPEILRVSLKGIHFGSREHFDQFTVLHSFHRNMDVVSAGPCRDAGDLHDLWSSFWSYTQNNVEPTHEIQSKLVGVLYEYRDMLPAQIELGRRRSLCQVCRREKRMSDDQADDVAMDDYAMSAEYDDCVCEFNASAKVLCFQYHAAVFLPKLLRVMSCIKSYSCAWTRSFCCHRLFEPRLLDLIVSFAVEKNEYTS